MNEDEASTTATVQSTTAASLAVKDYASILKDFAGKDLTQIFGDFAEAKKLEKRCPACLNEKWWVMSGPPNGITGTKYFSVSKDGSEYQQFAAQVLVSCINCGFERQHNMSVVHRWWKQRELSNGVRSE